MKLTSHLKSRSKPFVLECLNARMAGSELFALENHVISVY